MAVSGRNVTAENGEMLERIGLAFKLRREKVIPLILLVFVFVWVISETKRLALFQTAVHRAKWIST